MSDESGIGIGIVAPIEVSVRAESTGLGFGGSERQVEKRKQAAQSVSQFNATDEVIKAKKPDLMEKLLKQSKQEFNWKKKNKTRTEPVIITNQELVFIEEDVVEVEVEDDLLLSVIKRVTDSVRQSYLSQSRTDHLVIIKQKALEKSLAVNKKKLLVLSCSLSWLNDATAMINAELVSNSNSNRNPQTVVNLIEYVFSSLKPIFDLNSSDFDLIVTKAIPNLICNLLSKFMIFWVEGDDKVDDYDVLCLLTSVSSYLNLYLHLIVLK